MTSILSPYFTGAIVMAGKQDERLPRGFFPDNSDLSVETSSAGDTVTIVTLDDTDVPTTMERLSGKAVFLGMLGNARSAQNQLIQTVSELARLLKALPEGTLFPKSGLVATINDNIPISPLFDDPLIQQTIDAVKGQPGATQLIGILNAFQVFNPHVQPNANQIEQATKALGKNIPYIRNLLLTGKETAEHIFIKYIFSQSCSISNDIPLKTIRMALDKGLQEMADNIFEPVIKAALASENPLEALFSDLNKDVISHIGIISQKLYPLAFQVLEGIDSNPPIKGVALPDFIYHLTHGNSSLNRVTAQCANSATLSPRITKYQEDRELGKLDDALSTSKPFSIDIEDCAKTGSTKTAERFVKLWDEIETLPLFDTPQPGYSVPQNRFQWKIVLLEAWGKLLQKEDPRILEIFQNHQPVIHAFFEKNLSKELPDNSRKVLTVLKAVLCGELADLPSIEEPTYFRETSLYPLLEMQLGYLRTMKARHATGAAEAFTQTQGKLDNALISALDYIVLQKKGGNFYHLITTIQKQGGSTLLPVLNQLSQYEWSGIDYDTRGRLSFSSKRVLAGDIKRVTLAIEKVIDLINARAKT